MISRFLKSRSCSRYSRWLSSESTSTQTIEKPKFGKLGEFFKPRPQVEIAPKVKTLNFLTASVLLSFIGCVYYLAFTKVKGQVIIKLSNYYLL